MNYQKYLEWIVRILGSIVGVIVLALLIAGLVPVPTDALPSPDDYGAGALSVDPSVTGLLREFPQLTGMSNNPASPEKEKLGRLLFFDPILSEENDIACATCHHPDLGYTDGLPRAIGAGDQE